jgi:hypothetical protein
MRLIAGVLSLCAALVCVGATTVAAGDNPLPLGKKAVPEEYRGSLQRPTGISFGYTHMVDTMAISDFTFALGGQPLPPGAIQVSEATHTTSIFMGRFDTWVLPFLNVYAFAATLNGTASNVAFRVNPIPGMPALPIPSTIAPSYNGHLYGIGATLAGGYKKFFATYDINREWVTLNLFDTTVPALTQAIRSGVRGTLHGANAAVYAGGFHLSLRDAVLSGQNFIPGLPSGTFSLKARPTNAWNTLIGTNIEITRSLSITAEAGLGTRKQFTIMPSVRF